jgi:hypothetical protein
MNMLFLVI